MRSLVSEITLYGRPMWAPAGIPCVQEHVPPNTELLSESFYGTAKCPAMACSNQSSRSQKKQVSKDPCMFLIWYQEVDRIKGGARHYMYSGYLEMISHHLEDPGVRTLND